MPITAQQVLEVVQRQGPTIPNSIKQALGESDATMINVYLSQLKEQGKISFTNLQLGTSMFSYTPDQVDKLETLIKHLNDKDQRTANLLKEKKILRASEQDPLVRVSLQEIKDFAKPIKVTTKQGEEIFYRYYKVSLEEAQTIIRNQLSPQTEPEQTPETETKQEVQEQKPQPKQEEPKPLEPQKISEEKPKPVQKPEQQTSLSTPEKIESKFGQQVEAYCKKNNIAIKHYEEIRKDSDIELVLEVPTAVGTITFFAKARSKKSSNDGDLAAAILKAKTYNLPALYLTTGNVTNKALEQPELQDITVIELGS
jgi:hypothetical protein